MAHPIENCKIWCVFYQFLDDNHAFFLFWTSWVSCLTSTLAFCLFAYYFLISFSFCRHFWAMEKVLADSFFILKLKSVRVTLSSYFLPLSKIISFNSLAHSFPSASVASKTGTKVERSSWTALRLVVSLAIFASYTALCCSFVGSPLVLKCYSCLRKASTMGPNLASSFFKFWYTPLLASTSL